MKPILTIHKEIAKAEYAKSPLGQVEKKIAKCMEQTRLKGFVMPELEAKKIYEIRDANEKAQMEYIERTNKEHREAVDIMLLEAMTKELAIWEAFLQNNQNTTETIS